MKTHREREVYRNQNADASLWNKAINPATTDVQPSATFGIVENGYYTFVMDGPIHGQYRDKVRT